MNYLAIVLNIFLVFWLELYCVSGFKDCSPYYVDRYCALMDKQSAVECARKINISRPFEILDSCYDSVNPDGKRLTVDEKLEKLCNLDHDVYNALKQCHQTAVYIDLKQTKTVYKVLEFCISRSEIKEGKYCGLGNFFHHHHHH
ncbi:uncharacterized protein [Centruroides vittatus]|uniref:uncharacterized protein n=1 Tax=Centruroides vittatus TaxID=120091 RepID=UPI00350F6C6C